MYPSAITLAVLLLGAVGGTHGARTGGGRALARTGRGSEGSWSCNVLRTLLMHAMGTAMG